MNEKNAGDKDEANKSFQIDLEEQMVAESRLELIDQPPRMSRRIGAAITNKNPNLFARSK